MTKTTTTGGGMDDLTHGGWSRQEITVRLGRARLAKLKAVAASMAPGATPTEAIDHAIEQATSSRTEFGVRLARITEAIDAQAQRDHITGERMHAQLRALAQGVDGLRALISAVAEEE